MKIIGIRNSSFLAKGKEAEVADSPLVQRLARLGIVRIVDETETKADYAQEVVVEPEVQGLDPVEYDKEDEDPDVDDGDPDEAIRLWAYAEGFDIAEGPIPEEVRELYEGTR